MFTFWGLIEEGDYFKADVANKTGAGKGGNNGARQDMERQRYLDRNKTKARWSPSVRSGNVRLWILDYKN